MVTHIPPPSPSQSSTSIVSPPHSTTHSASSAYGHPPSSRSRYHLRTPQFPPSAYPPSPPSSYANSQYADTVVPPSNRRAPSLSSRASTSAARPSGRHSRSSSRARTEVASQTNAFPWFAQTGDVEIIIRDRTGRRREKKFLLHSLILAQNAGFFKAEFGDQATGPGTAAIPGATTMSRIDPTAQVSPQRKWRYELDWGDPSASGDDALPILVQTAAVSSSSPPAAPPKPHGSSFRNLTSSSVNINTSSGSSVQRDDDLITAYDNLFRTFYNHTPRLDMNTLATAYVECKVLLSLASLYAALPAAGPRVDHHLLRFQGRLWRQIAKYPPSYLKLGHLARSRAIFSEALIHIAGAWPTHEAQLRRGAVDDSLMDLVEDKVDELEDVRSRVELKLFRLTLTTSRGERVGPNNAWTDWLAVSLFRQWLAENTTPAPSSILKDSSSRSSRAPPNAGKVFRQIGASGEAYLTHDELKAFLKARPEGHYYSRDNLKRFERRVDELKNIARDAVKPLMRNFLELDEGRVRELSYLTCCRIEDRDLSFVWTD